MELNFLLVAMFFAFYVLVVLLVEKKIIYEPRDLLEKFLAFMLLYAGISIIYFSITGEPFLSETEASYRTYLFLIGFIAMMWSIPNILSEFTFFKQFMEDKKPKTKVKKKKKIKKKKLKQ